MPEHNHPPQTCAEALHVFEQRDFVRWRGLPRSCSLSDVTAQFPRLNQGEGRARLGRGEARFVMVVAATFSEPVRVWLKEDQVFVLDAAAADLSPELPTLLTALGPPAAILDCRRDMSVVERGERVYPNRGLALFVDTDQQYLARVAVFAATTLEEYEATFRLHLGRRRIPESRSESL